MRLNFDYKQNEIAMSCYLTDRVEEIARAMGGREVKVNPMQTPYDIAPCQTIDEHEPSAGGLGLPAPFGTTYTANLTPDEYSFIGDWSDEELADCLRHGRNGHTAAFGPMAEVVEKSTRWLTDDDLNAIVSYVKDLPFEHPEIAQREPVGADDLAMSRGSLIYAATCSACHGPNGEDVENQFGHLAGSSLTQSENPLTVVRLILEGARSVPTDRYPTPLAMPAFDWWLSDEDVADVATYVRNAFRNAAPAVSADTVAGIHE